MLIGSYTEALEILGEIGPYFVIAGAFYAISLNELGILRTRYSMLTYIAANKLEVSSKYQVQVI